MPSRTSQKRLHHHAGHALPRKRSPAQYKRCPAEFIPRTPASAMPSRTSQKRHLAAPVMALPHQRSPAPHKRRPAELIPPSRERRPNATPSRTSQKRHLAAPVMHSHTGEAPPRTNAARQSLSRHPANAAKCSAFPYIAEAPSRRAGHGAPAQAKLRPAQTLPGRAYPANAAKRNASPYIAEAPTSPRRSCAPAPVKPAPHGHARPTAPDAVAPTGAVPASPPLYTQMLACASILFAHASILSYFHKIRLFSGE